MHDATWRLFSPRRDTYAVGPPSMAAGRALHIKSQYNRAHNRLITRGPSVWSITQKLAGFDLGSRMSHDFCADRLETGQDLDIEKSPPNLQHGPKGWKLRISWRLFPALAHWWDAGTNRLEKIICFKMAATLASQATYSDSGGAPAVGNWRPWAAIGGGARADCKGATITCSDPRHGRRSEIRHASAGRGQPVQSQRGLSRVAGPLQGANLPDNKTQNRRRD